MLVVCERWVGDKDRLLFWPKVLLSTTAALLPHLGLVAQSWVTEGTKTSVAGSQFGILSPTDTNSNSNSLKKSVSWWYFCLSSTCFRLLTQVHLLIDGSVEGQYVTQSISISKPCSIKFYIKHFLKHFYFSAFLFLKLFQCSSTSKDFLMHSYIKTLSNTLLHQKIFPCISM